MIPKGRAVKDDKSFDHAAIQQVTKESQTKKLYVNQFNTFSDRNLLPLAAGLLTSYVRHHPVLNKHYQPDIIVRRQDPRLTVAGYDDPDVLGFSVYVWNLSHSLSVARMAKELFPRSMVVMGGPSIPRYIEDVQRFFAKHPYVDVLVRGEGEVTFAELLLARLEGRSLQGVSGIIYRTDQVGLDFIRTPDRERITDLDMLPSPFLDGTFDEFLLSHRSEITGALWESNRGCPYSCAFCDWGQSKDKRIILYSEERLFLELDWIARNNISYIFSADANFGLKKRDLRLAQYIGDLRASTGHPSYLLVNWLKNSHSKVLEIANTLRSSGLGFMVTMSIQSFNPETLKAVKRNNIKLETFENLKREFNALGINTYSELMLGLPEESYASFTKGMVKVLSPLPQDHFALYLTIVIPNAELANPEYRSRYQLETRSCEVAMARRSIFNRTTPEMEEIVVGTKSMPTNDWCKAYRFGALLRVMHNMRLAFFSLEFLREHYGISPKEFIEWLLQKRDEPASPYLKIAEAIGIFNKYIESILNHGQSVLPMSEYGDIRWEPHEMFFLQAYAAGDKFIKEIETATTDFAATLGSLIDHEMIKEVSRFQSCLSPIDPHTEPFRQRFSYDWVGYYQALIRGDKNIAIDKSSNIVEFRSSFSQYLGEIPYEVSTVRDSASSHVRMSSFTLCAQDEF